MGKRLSLGLTYVGSKNRISKDICEVLPAGTRLIDLFGGGGAIAHRAVLMGKWEEVVYNDHCPLISELVKEAISGKIRPFDFVRREEFLRELDRDGFIKFIWSFGANGATYMYGKKIEDVVEKMHHWIVDGTPIEGFPQLEGETIEARRLEFGQLARANKLPTTVKQLQHLERINRVRRMSGLPLTVTTMDYREYQYQEGDVVYCDIPYEDTLDERYYTRTFDVDAFWTWAKAQSYPVYVSSYKPGAGARRIWAKEVKSRLNPKSGMMTEKLYKI